MGPSLLVGWNLSSETSSRSRWSASRRPQTLDGSVVDATETGASILAPSDSEIVPGSSVVLDYRSEICTVLVRRVEPTDRAGHSVYGVTFVDPPAHMVEGMVDSANQAGIHRRSHLWS